MKYLIYTTIEEANSKQEYITDVCKANGIFNEQTTKFCDVETNSGGTEFYIPYDIQRTKGFGYESSDALNAKILESKQYYPWHEQDKIYQVRLSFENNNRLMNDYPDFAVYRKENNIIVYTLSPNIFFYLNWFIPEHKILLENYGAIISEKIN